MRLSTIFLQGEADLSVLILQWVSSWIIKSCVDQRKIEIFTVICNKSGFGGIISSNHESQARSALGEHKNN